MRIAADNANCICGAYREWALQQTQTENVQMRLFCSYTCGICHRDDYKYSSTDSAAALKDENYGKPFLTDGAIFLLPLMHLNRNQVMECNHKSA